MRISRVICNSSYTQLLVHADHQMMFKDFLFYGKMITIKSVFWTYSLLDSMLVLYFYVENVHVIFILN